LSVCITPYFNAEVLALMLAEAATGSFSLHGANLPEHVLVTTCEPCAMCLGAILWSGVRRVVCAAGRDDALRIGFEEGPVFPESYDYLRNRGVMVVRDMLAAEARDVMESYRDRGGLLYNG
jgi:tRNA(Arg) A34 adenosine deaminase TadA